MSIDLDRDVVVLDRRHFRRLGEREFGVSGIMAMALVIADDADVEAELRSADGGRLLRVRVGL